MVQNIIVLLLKLDEDNELEECNFRLCFLVVVIKGLFQR